MSKLSIQNGLEGPREDPYSYEELTFSKEDLTVTIHLGLDEWITINGKKSSAFDENNIIAMFADSTGLTVLDFKRAYDRINHPAKCPKCNSKKRGYESGFPGESFEVCGNCGEVINCYFNEAAIM